MVLEALMGLEALEALKSANKIFLYHNFWAIGH